DAGESPADDEALHGRVRGVEQPDTVGEVADVAVLDGDAGSTGDIDPGSGSIRQPLDRKTVQIDGHVVCTDNETRCAALQRLGERDVGRDAVAAGGRPRVRGAGGGNDDRGE